MFKKIQYFCLFFGLLAPFWLATAASQQIATQGPVYKVELIVFAHVTPQGLLSEDWPAMPVLPRMQRVYDLKSMPQVIGLSNQNDTPASPAPAQLYQILSPTNLTLTKEANKLNANGNYPILVHVAWLQPGLPIRNAKRIHIYGGQAYTATGQLATAISPLNLNGNSAALPTPNTNIQWQLNGYVRVSKPYLFQLHADLVLTIPKQLLAQVSTTAASQLKTNQFILQQTFRMRLGQLYYIDHPLFGILAEVTKYSQQTKTTQ